ncbi:BLUF domain-containing protein [Sphingorhabdus sp. SMR4y]|uniref:BLUF domain-containing protein n=1 Tax=Sphingorhabdus sp. SMR4y TaxID=2584094 RepID=UPI000B5C2015|nr:BLUF domain-containing protein [Sphingorhabdus sp. SMR4y]ASK87928.1 blue light- and temperature-regulated antirepressor BluF [Sphingorhabdus sp. SMR4y]
MNAFTSSKQFSRILYTSRLDVDQCGEKPQQTAREIAEASAVQNQSADLTGSLLFVDGTFIQILEGPSDALENAFERICCDFRHVDLQLIDLSSVSERLFEGWDMACLCEDEDNSLALRDGLQEVRFLVGVNANQATLQMRSLLDSHSAEGNAENKSSG